MLATCHTLDEKYPLYPSWLSARGCNKRQMTKRKTNRSVLTRVFHTRVGETEGGQGSNEPCALSGGAPQVPMLNPLHGCIWRWGTSGSSEVMRAGPRSCRMKVLVGRDTRELVRVRRARLLRCGCSFPPGPRRAPLTCVSSIRRGKRRSENLPVPANSQIPSA